MSDYASFDDLVAASLSADLKQEEERYRREAAAHKALQAKTRSPGSLGIDELLAKITGADAPAPTGPVAPAVPKKVERTEHAFPPPPSSK